MANKANLIVKLPTPLSKFDGDYAWWRQFYHLFTGLVLRQSTTDYKSSIICLSGPLRHFTPSETSYDAAHKVINARYKNNRLIVNPLLTKFITQNINVGNATPIRSLDECRDVEIRNLQVAIGVAYLLGIVIARPQNIMIDRHVPHFIGNKVSIRVKCRALKSKPSDLRNKEQRNPISMIFGVTPSCATY